jgi:hypothetical protein
MGTLALAEVMLGSAFLDPSALQWYLRTRQECMTPEMFEQLITRRWSNMNVRPAPKSP